MKKITSVLISCYNKNNLDILARQLSTNDITIYCTGGTATYLKEKNIDCILVEDLTGYPSMLRGRVKTLHPILMGGILANSQDDASDIQTYKIPLIDMVIVDLYPFAEAVYQQLEEADCIEKIDIGGITLLRAAAKNFNDCAVVSSIHQYTQIISTLEKQNNQLSLDQRKQLAKEAFSLVADYDQAIANYFDSSLTFTPRYGENPHQQASFTGNLKEVFTHLHGKEISYNNLLDINVAFGLLADLDTPKAFWGIIKHGNICGASIQDSEIAAWNNALQGDSESAFGGVLFSNIEVTKDVAAKINEIFCEIVLAPEFDDDALAILKQKKNRIILRYQAIPNPQKEFRSILNGTLQQDKDIRNYDKWDEVGGRTANTQEKEDLAFANILCKHLKSNAIAIVKNNSLIGKGCGQTSRIDAVKQAIQKAQQFNNNLEGSVLSSDAFFPFDDCVRLGSESGIVGFIQPGGSIRDKDSIAYCQKENLIMVLTQTRHFKH